MDFDPEATLRCWPIHVDVAGHTYLIPGLPATDWLLAVNTGTYSAVVPGMLEDPTVLDDLLIEDDTTNISGECMAAARAAVAAASGTRWWVAYRLAHAATQTGIGAELTLTGVDPNRIPFGAYLAAAYRTGQKLLSDSNRAMWDMELEQAPDGVAPEDWFDETAAADGFMAAMSGGG